MEFLILDIEGHSTIYTRYLDSTKQLTGANMDSHIHNYCIFIMQIYIKKSSKVSISDSWVSLRWIWLIQPLYVHCTSIRQGSSLTYLFIYLQYGQPLPPSKFGQPITGLFCCVSTDNSYKFVKNR